MTESAVAGLIIVWVLLGLLAIAGSLALSYWIMRMAVRGGLRDHHQWAQSQRLLQEFPEEFEG
jgi:hypothetical protein